MDAASTPGTSTRPRSGGPAVVADDVSVDYGTRRALSAATFAIPVGTRTAVIGPNGSGKTTLLRVLGNLVTPTTGSVEVLGAVPGARRGAVAHVLQATHINPGLPLTVREVVTMGRYPHVGLLGRLRAVDRAAVQHAMERMEVADLAGRQVVELSGGQRQRVSVAQGLAQEADLLLLDEPVTGLDAPSLQRIEAVVHEEADAGRTVVMTTHDIAEAARADHVVLLATRLVATGHPDVVLTQENLAAAYGAMTFTTADGTVVIGDPHVHGGVHTHE